MNLPFNCELHFVNSPHLYQIYDGFKKLEKKKIINLSIKKNGNNYGSSKKPLLEVLFKNEYKIIYDTLDGLNWFNGPEKDNLEYFRDNFSADFYFKRSYCEEIQNYKPEGCKVFPLGLFYRLKPEEKLPSTFKQRIKYFLNEMPLLSGYLSEEKFSSDYFEHYPVPNKNLKILFLARLWSPKKVKQELFKEETYRINSNRIAFIRKCKKEFPERFLGGLQDNSYTREISKDLIMPKSITNKKNYLQAVKNHDICISTMGLFESIGGKFGEYVAASRAIVSEPLRYQVPGKFIAGENYLTFYDSDQLIENIYSLIEDRDLLSKMMINNYHYYNNYLRPDSLILNTLLKVEALTQ